jgi:hypothetical protein
MQILDGRYIYALCNVKRTEPEKPSGLYFVDLESYI